MNKFYKGTRKDLTLSNLKTYQCYILLCKRTGRITLICVFFMSHKPSVYFIS
uniref:Uncharacterized protein n=1 Tax=Inoviridae sp. ctJfE44 TaxID=2825779 RepID=A0A8S5UB92_9VIRU|nr:MAG TPA: hypothetical protein [Inoviridae sp. ctJfE44]DAX03542.1 MAG TPA: hypothetical protein [Inoviridae sp.]